MSDVVEKDVREIKYRVDAIEKSVDLLVRANRKEITEDLLIFFGKSTERIRVFLAIDGTKTVAQIAQSLGIHPQNVSRRVTQLERAGLIVVARTVGSAKIFAKTEKVAILNMEPKLERLLSRKYVEPAPEEGANDDLENRSEGTN